jgi:hypothetical protein
MLLRNYINENTFQASALKGARVSSNWKFSLQPYCIINDVELEAGELCKLGSFTICIPHKILFG